jgi:hypothetical protein
MALADEAKTLGSDLLYLIPGNLKERKALIKTKYNLDVPSYSYALQLKSLFDQIGVVETAQVCLAEYMPTLQPKSELLLRKSANQPLTQKEVEDNALWDFVDENFRINQLGAFVIKYGPRMSSRLDYHQHLYSKSEALSTASSNTDRETPWFLIMAKLKSTENFQFSEN